MRRLMAAGRLTALPALLDTIVTAGCPLLFGTGVITLFVNDGQRRPTLELAAGGAAATGTMLLAFLVISASRLMMRDLEGVREHCEAIQPMYPSNLRPGNRAPGNPRPGSPRTGNQKDVP